MAYDKGSAPNDGRGMGGPGGISPEASVEGEPKKSAPNEFKDGKFGPKGDDGPNPGRAPGAR